MSALKGYIHSFNEASLIVHAVRLGLIQPTTQRLSPLERDQIQSGSIYCFIEQDKGMKRWTDGKIWSPSKILGHFLLYKEVPKHLSKSALKKNRHKRRLSDSREYNRRGELVNDEFSMYKKTISFTHEDITYHIVSYFQPIFDKHGIIEYPFFRSLNTAIINYPKLLDDKFIKENFNKETESEWKILPFKPKFLIANINRKDLELITCDILSSKLMIPPKFNNIKFFVEKNGTG